MSGQRSVIEIGAICAERGRRENKEELRKDKRRGREGGRRKKMFNGAQQTGTEVMVVA